MLSYLYRTVRVAMQVPVVMTTSLGQKISTVAMQQPAGTTGAAGHTTLLANTPAIGAAAGNANSQQKVCTCGNSFTVSALLATAARRLIVS